jgi:hypothetical protein
MAWAKSHSLTRSWSSGPAAYKTGIIYPYDDVRK